MFDADRPILSSNQDRLNRAVFAKYLARCMLDHSEPESLVIGLYGGWGAGKTSIINMVVEELQYASTNTLDPEKPILLNFSAWSYSGQDQLIYSFFRRLSSALRSAEYLENAEQIIYLLELYVSFFTHQAVPKPLRRKRSWWQRLTGQAGDEYFAWESGRDLTLVKAELNALLARSKHKIIIIIDNISRLYDYEIKQIFQIVKSIGDYANTVYLLSFDKDQVIQAIDDLEGTGGKEFVEKIIQLPFEIPAIQHQDMENILADRLNEVIKLVPANAWNAEYWTNVYYTALRYFCENCRDITRYVNILSFSYPRVRDVVNPVDFFALSAIETFCPQVYLGIRENKDLFSDLLDNVYQLDNEQLKKDKLRCDEIISRGERISREKLLSLLLLLFPRLRLIYEPSIPFYHSELIARKERRVCCPDLFEVYFRLSMQPGYVPDAEFETILALANDDSTFDQAITRLNQDERISQFLDKLDSHVLQTIPLKHIPTIVTALIDNGDLFPIGISGPLRLDTPMRIHRIIQMLLKRFNSSQERFQVLQQAFAKATKSLFIMVNELREQRREHLDMEDTFLPLEFRQITPEELASLQTLVVSRIKFWAENGSLITHPRLISILYAWSEWGDENDCRRYVSEVVSQDRGLVAFLQAALEKPINQAILSNVKDPQWEIYLDEIEAFIPTSLLTEHAKEIFQDNYFEKLTEREQLAIMIFLDLLNIRANKLIPKTN